MAVKKKYKYPMPDVVREFIAEFLGNFIQFYLLLTSYMFRFLQPNVVKRAYFDPDYCTLLTNGTYSCPKGKSKGDHMHYLQLEALYSLTIAVTWASGLLGGLMVSLPVSGGYLNPAISVTLATMSRLEWKKLLHYIPAQYLGAFFASAFFHVLYYKHMEGKDEILIEVLVSTPHPKINMWTAIVDSFFPSAMFSMFLFAILDRRKNSVPKYAQPLLLTFTLIGIVLGCYADTKLQLSPARDFSTRLYAALVVGFEPAFSSYSYCFWWLPKQICLYAGFLGGGWLYVGLFSSNIYEKALETKDQNKSDVNNKEEKNLMSY